MDISKRLRDITKKEAEDSYKELKETPSRSPDFSRVGLKALDYFFFNHRIKAKTKRHISFYDAIRNRELTQHLNTLIVRYKKKSLDEYDDVGRDKN